MSVGFVHSVKVPQIYKISAKIIKEVREGGASLKTLIFEKRHPNVNGIYALTYNALQYEEKLNYLLRKTGLLIKEPRLDPWLARILITELLWGKQKLTAKSKPLETVRNYENSLRDVLKNIPQQSFFLDYQKTVEKPRYVRINTLLISLDEAISYFEYDGWELLSKPPDYSSYLKTLSRLTDSFFLQDFHIPELFVFPSKTKFFYNEYYKSGKIILQDKASCLPSFLLNPSPESMVLDMCAAPGMKTSHLAAIMKNKGIIYACEIDRRRYETLCKQVDLTNATCVKPLNQDALTLDEKQCPKIEFILVDPSCSGSGMIDRPKLDTDNHNDPQRLKNLQSFQVFLLKHALLNFPLVKKVVYSTCSVNPEENEEVLDEILFHIKGSYKLISAKKMLKNEWENFSSKNYNCGDTCIYARPEYDFCNGFFVAIFERDFNIPLPEYKKRSDWEKNVSYNSSNNIAEKLIDTNIKEGEEENLYKKKKKRKKKKHTMENIDESKETLEKLTIVPEKKIKIEKNLPDSFNEYKKINEENEFLKINDNSNNLNKKLEKEKHKSTKEVDNNSEELIKVSKKKIKSTDEVEETEPAKALKNKKSKSTEETQEIPKDLTKVSKQKKSKSTGEPKENLKESTKALKKKKSKSIEETQENLEDATKALKKKKSKSIEESEENLEESAKVSKKRKSKSIEETENNLEDFARVSKKKKTKSTEKPEENFEELDKSRKKKKSKKQRVEDN